MKIFLLIIFLLQPWLLGGLIRFDIIAVFFASVCLFFSGPIKLKLPHVIVSIFLLSLCTFITVIHGQFDVSYINLALKLLVVYFGAYIITELYELNVEDIRNSIRWASLLCVVYFVLCVFFPTIQNFSLLLKGNTYGIENRLEFYRLWFPTSAHTFHLGLFFFMAFLIQIGAKEKFIWLIPTLVCAGISSRSALFACIGVLVVHVFVNKRSLILPSALFLIFSIGFAITLSEDSMMAKYAMEPIINLIDGKGIESKSTDKLLEKHLYIPEESTLLLGDGRYFDEEGFFYGGTDSGIVRPILYGGIIFQVVYFSVLLFLLYSLTKFGMVGFVGVFLLLLMNIKAEVLTPGPHFALLALLYWNFKYGKA